MEQNYTPARATNAIDAALFVFFLDRPLNESEIMALKEACASNELEKDFPQYEEMNVQYVAINFGSENVQQAPPTQLPAPAGFFYRDFTRSGRIAWEIKVDNNTIAICCNEYSRWNDVIQKVQHISHILMSAIQLRQVVKTIHTCVDKIVFDGSPEQYKFEKIFNLDSEYLNKKTANNTPPWHLHQGAFKDYQQYSQTKEDLGFVLDILNIGTLLEFQKVNTILEQVNELNFHTPIRCEQLLGKLSTIFDTMHQHNKNVVRSVLNSNMLTAIGLN